MLTLSIIHIILMSIFRMQDHEINCHYMLGERTSERATEKGGEMEEAGNGGVAGE